jgi:two-component sensor histidine kinase
VSSDGDEGFGSKLLNRSVTGHLGGSIKTDWADDGIIVTLTMNAGKLAE